MSTGNTQKKKQNAGNAAFSPRFDELIEALEALYITGNLSGRLKFREAWPLAAEKIFGPELMTFDADGTKDKARRAALEQEAEVNRQNLLSELADVKEKSTKNSMLELDYIKAAIQKYGREFSAYIYPENLLEKFMPAAPAAPQSRPVAGHSAAAAVPISTEVDDVPDDIAPIDAGASPRPEQQAFSPPNLAQKMQIVQAKPIYAHAIPYDELVRRAEAAEQAKPAIQIKALFNERAAAGGAASQSAAPEQ